MASSSANPFSHLSNPEGDSKLDSLILSLLHAYCERVPVQPAELRYMEIGGPEAPEAWRTGCVAHQLAAQGVLVSSDTEQAQKLQAARPRDSAIFARLVDGEIASAAPANTNEAAGSVAAKNQLCDAPSLGKRLDDLLEQDFPFNRLDHLVVHGDPDNLWQIRTCEFSVARPYLLHFVAANPLSSEQTRQANTHFQSRDFVLIAVRPTDLIFLDSLAFVRPEQSSAFIV